MKENRQVVGKNVPLGDLFTRANEHGVEGFGVNTTNLQPTLALRDARVQPPEGVT